MSALCSRAARVALALLAAGGALATGAALCEALSLNPSRVEYALKKLRLYLDARHRGRVLLVATKRGFALVGVGDSLEALWREAQAAIDAEAENAATVEDRMAAWLDSERRLNPAAFSACMGDASALEVQPRLTGGGL